MKTLDTLAPMPRRTARPGAFASVVDDTSSVVQAATLLGKRQSVEIEHNGQRYRLQTTKAGKLILTK